MLDPRRGPSKMVGGVKSHLESNPLPTSDAQRVQMNLVCTRTQRPCDTEPELFECLLRRYGSAVACSWDRSSGSSRPGYGISPLEEVAINPTIEPPEFTRNWGNRLLEGINRTLNENHSHRKLTNNITWTTALSNSMKL